MEQVTAVGLRQSSGAHVGGRQNLPTDEGSVPGYEIIMVSAILNGNRYEEHGLFLLIHTVYCI